MATCRVDNECGFGTCASGHCYCLDVFVSGDRCQDHILTHPVVYAYLSLSLLAYALVVLRFYRELRYLQSTREGTKAASGGFAPSTVMGCMIYIVVSWGMWLLTRLLMWEEGIARMARGSGMLFSSLTLPLLVMFGSRMAWQFNYVKRSVTHDDSCAVFWTAFKNAHWVLVWPITLIKLYFLIPGPNRSFQWYFVLDSATALLALLLFQLPVSTYGHYVLKVLKVFPDKNQGMIAKIHAAAYWGAAATTVSIAVTAFNVIQRPLWNDLGVFGTICFDFTRVAGVPVFAILMANFSARASYSWIRCSLIPPVHPGSPGSRAADAIAKGDNDAAGV